MCLALYIYHAQNTQAQNKQYHFRIVLMDQKRPDSLNNLYVNGENCHQIEEREWHIAWMDGGPCRFGLNMPINFNKVQLTSVCGIPCRYSAVADLITIANVIMHYARPSSDDMEGKNASEAWSCHKWTYCNLGITIIICNNNK